MNVKVPRFFCESCFRPLIKKGIQEDEKYCIHCYSKGKFFYEGNNVKDFQKVYYENLLLHENNKWCAKLCTLIIPFAPRWNNRTHKLLELYIFILPKLVEYLSICIQRIKKINFISLLKSTIKILLALLVIFFYSMIALSGILEKNPIPFVLCSIPLWIFLIKYQFKSKWDSIRYYFYGITLGFLATYYLLTSYVMALGLLGGLHDEGALTALGFFGIFAGGFIAVPVLLVLSSICLYKLLYRKSEFEQWKSLIWFCVPGVVYLPMLIAGFPHTPIGDVVMSFFNGMIH